MAIYVDKGGNLLKSSPYDAQGNYVGADKGSSSVPTLASDTINNVVSGVNTKPSNNPEIIRNGKDIYAMEGGNLRKLGETEFMRDYATNPGTVIENGVERRIGGGTTTDYGQMTPAQSSSLISNAVGSNTGSQGSNGVRSDLASLQQIADEVTGAGTSAGKSETDIIKEISDGLAKSFEESSLEAERVRQAGLNAGYQFDPLIRDAEEQKRQGFSKAMVGAGERGGFMNTQISGVGALTPTQGGTFAGVGGQLENIKSAYDRNISDLQSKKVMAIQAAESAMRESIRSGKASDMKMAMDLYNTANQASALALQQQQAKANILIALGNAKRAEEMAPFEMASKKYEMLSKIPAGETVTIDGVNYKGLSSPDPFFSGAEVVSLMKELPVGKTQTITDPNTNEKITITGLNQPTVDTQVFSVADAKGNMTYTTIDKKTGQVVGTPVQQIGTGKGFKNTGGGGGGGINTDPNAYTTKDFYTAAQNEVLNNLHKGESWSVSWNRMKQRFPNVPNDKIDTALGGNAATPGQETGWAKPGAFEEWKEKQYKQDTNMTPSETESLIWQGLSTTQVGKSEEEQKQWIMQMGGNPADFGIY